MLLTPPSTVRQKQNKLQRKTSLSYMKSASKQQTASERQVTVP